MATKYTKEQNKAIITELATQNGLDPCLLLTICQIESNFNNTVVNSYGFAGLFQLGNGYGGVSGDDRLDPYKNTQGAINGLKSNLAYLRSYGYENDWYGYLAHQQGKGGAMELLQHPDKKVYEFPYGKSSCGNNIQCNGCKNAYTYQDWVTCWEAKFMKIYKSCNPSTFSIPNATTAAEIVAYSILIAGTAGLSYYLLKNKQKNMKKVKGYLGW